MVLSRWLAPAFVALIGASTPLQANEPGLSPEQVVRRYSRTVACQVDPAVEGFRQFAAVQLEPGYADGGFGAIWLMVRYRWHRGWDPAGRFKRLP